MGCSATTPDEPETAVELIIDARTEHLRDDIALLIVEVAELKLANKMTNPALLFCFLMALLDLGKNYLHWF